MPTYVYRRADGKPFPDGKPTREIEQRISDKPLEVWPDTDIPVVRVISGGDFFLRGGGWYKSPPVN